MSIVEVDNGIRAYSGYSFCMVSRSFLSHASNRSVRDAQLQTLDVSKCQHKAHQMQVTLMFNFLETIKPWRHPSHGGTFSRLSLNSMLKVFSLSGMSSTLQPKCTTLMEMYENSKEETRQGIKEIWHTIASHVTLTNIKWIYDVAPQGNAEILPSIVRFGIHSQSPDIISNWFLIPPLQK